MVYFYSMKKKGNKVPKPEGIRIKSRSKDPIRILSSAPRGASAQCKFEDRNKNRIVYMANTSTTEARTGEGRYWQGVTAKPGDQWQRGSGRGQSGPMGRHGRGLADYFLEGAVLRRPQLSASVHGAMLEFIPCSMVHSMEAIRPCSAASGKYSLSYILYIILYYVNSINYVYVL